MRNIGGAGLPTVIFPFLCNAAQLWDTVHLGVEVQDALSVKALARLDEVKVNLLELPDLNNMIFGPFELSECQHSASNRGSEIGHTVLCSCLKMALTLKWAAQRR